MTGYSTFEEWFAEQEGFSVRAERFDGDVAWLKAAFEAGRTEPAAGVSVKPLEWKRRTEGGVWRAETLIGEYRVWTHHEADGAWFWNLTGGATTKSDKCLSEEAAKAAAEADYRNRILSALLPKATAPVVSEPVAAIDRAMDCDSWPKWLGDIVDLAIQASDAADMSTEQSIAYAILHYAASPQPEVTEEVLERVLRAWYSDEYDSAKLSPEVRQHHREKARAALEAFVKGE